MTLRRCQFSAVTLVELLVASTVMVFLVAMTIPFAVAQLRASSEDTVREAMRVEASLARAYFIHDFETASTQQILPDYTTDQTKIQGVALPVNGRLDTTTGTLVWDRAAIYYVLANADGTKSLVRALVTYADYAANKADNAIIHSLLNGTWPAAKTLHKRTVLKRVTDYTMSVQSVRIDCYAANYGKKQVFLGSALLAPNQNHTVRFECMGANTQSVGNKIAVDRIVTSRAVTSLEAEKLTITASDSTCTVDGSRLGAAWGNNAVLSAAFANPTPAAPQGFTLQFFNDVWWDTDFQGAHSLAKTSLAVDVATSNDIVAVIDGSNTTTWAAVNQTGNSPTMFGTNMEGQTVRVVLPGNVSEGYSPVTTTSGGHPRITFSASWFWTMKILAATIMERSSGFNGSTDTSKCWTIKFGGSTTSATFSGDLVSDPVLGMDFDNTKSYLVSYAVASNSSGHYVPMVWWTANGDPGALSMVVAGNYAATPTWTGLGGTAYTADLGVKSVYVSFPCAASFLSDTLDTQETTANQPTFGTATVNKTDVANATIAVSWRSGAASDFSGTGESTWYASINAVPKRRYVQYKADFTTTQPITASPMLRDVKLTWIPSTTKSVDLAADVAVGPDLGMFQVKVDGNPPLMDYIHLWFKSELTYRDTTFVLPLAIDLNPRNP